MLSVETVQFKNRSATFEVVPELVEERQHAGGPEQVQYFTDLNLTG